MVQETGVKYTKADSHYFEKRGLQRYAGIWSLWALGVERLFPVTFPAGTLASPRVAGAACWLRVLSSPSCMAAWFLYRGNESGPSTHWCCLFICPHGHESARGGFLTGLCENVEYVVTPAVIVTFITAYVNGIFGFDAVFADHRDRHLFDIPVSEYLRGCIVVQGYSCHHLAVASRADCFLDQRHPQHGLQPLGP